MRVLVVIVLGIAILIAAWMGRVSTIAVSQKEGEGQVFTVITDRWTGRVYACDTTGCMQIYQPARP